MSAIDGSELDGYEALVSALRSNPPVAPDSLRQRVLEGAPARRPRRSKKRRLAFVVVPLVVVAAVGAAFVHGFQNSGPRSANAPAPLLGVNLNSATGTTPEAAQVPAGAHTASKTVQKGAKERVLAPTASWNSAYGLQTAGSGSAVNGTLDAGAPRALKRLAHAPNAYAPVTIPRSRLVHATAALQLRVKGSDLSAKTNEASQIAGQFGGYAQSVHFENSHQGGGSSVLELRVPVQKAQAAIAKLLTLGKLVSQQVSTQDLQQKLTQQTSQIGSLRRAITVYETALQSTTISASDRATLQIRLNNARRQLSQARHVRRGTLASGATADISLLLVTRSSAIVTPQHHGSSRIGRLLGSAAHFLALEGIIVLYALIVLAPVLLIGGLVWWILRERRRREERLLSTA
jgi:hypothetical protein